MRHHMRECLLSKGDLLQATLFHPGWANQDLFCLNGMLDILITTRFLMRWSSLKLTCSMPMYVISIAAKLVAIRHLAPAGSEPSSVQPPEHIRNDDPVRIPQHNIPPVTLSSNNDSEHQKSNYTPDNTPIIDNAPAILKSTRTLNAPIDDNAPVIAGPRRSTRERRLPARFIQEMYAAPILCMVHGNVILEYGCHGENSIDIHCTPPGYCASNLWPRSTLLIYI